MRMKIKSYEDLTLEKWQALRSIDWNENIDDVERQAGIIGVLCDLSVAEVMKMPLAEYKECAMAAEFLRMCRYMPIVRSRRASRKSAGEDSEFCHVSSQEKTKRWSKSNG